MVCSLEYIQLRWIFRWWIYIVMWTNMLWPCKHINVENMLNDVLYAERLQEASVWQEHKRLKKCKKNKCILKIK